nr:HD domain-containing phosphohydrolase [Azospirillum thermophilum]
MGPARTSPPRLRPASPPEDPGRRSGPRPAGDGARGAGRLQPGRRRAVLPCRGLRRRGARAAVPEPRHRHPAAGAGAGGRGGRAGVGPPHPQRAGQPAHRHHRLHRPPRPGAGAGGGGGARGQRLSHQGRADPAHAAHRGDRASARLRQPAGAGGRAQGAGQDAGGDHRPAGDAHPRRAVPNILPRVVGLLGIGHHALLCIQGDTLPRDRKFRVRASTGRFARWKDVEVSELGEPRVEAAMERLSPSSETIVEPDYCALRLRANGGITGMIYVEGRNDGTAREWQLLELFRNKCSIAFENALLIEELNTSQKATVLAMASLAEYKDNAAAGHLHRIERLVGEIARELLRRGRFSDELDGDYVEKVGLASLLHDVGMLSVSDETLGVPGELASNDMQMIQRHTEIGHRILAEAAVPLRGRSLLSIAAEIARYHHERYDGSGYLEGLRGDAIPIGARIMAVADVFDALITPRQYRDAWSVEQAISWVTGRAGKDFDPVVVEAFVEVVRRFQAEDPGWFPKPGNGGPGMLGGLIGRKLRALFGRRAEMM